MTTPQTPQQIASRVWARVVDQTDHGPPHELMVYDDDVRKLESDLAEMREENERLKHQMQKPRVCDQTEINELQAQLRDLRGKADGLAEICQRVSNYDITGIGPLARLALTAYRAAQGVEG